MAERRELIRRLNRIQGKSYEIEDLSEVEMEIYGLYEAGNEIECQKGKGMHEKISADYC